jgi:hypothetical protein
MKCGSRLNRSTGRDIKCGSSLNRSTGREMKCGSRLNRSTGREMKCGSRLNPSAGRDMKCGSRLNPSAGRDMKCGSRLNPSAGRDMRTQVQAQSVAWENLLLSQRAGVAAKHAEAALSCGEDANGMDGSLWHCAKFGVCLPACNRGHKMHGVGKEARRICINAHPSTHCASVDPTNLQANPLLLGVSLTR